MNNLVVSKTKDFLMLDGKKFFYLADTVWMGFCRMTIDEWKSYLAYRKEQGFNVLQLVLVPATFDTTMSSDTICPFKRTSTGDFDYKNINNEFFDKALLMSKIAIQAGFILNIAPSWSNIIPGTWSSKLASESTIPLNLYRDYISYVVDFFSEINPIYMTAGDTDMNYASTIEYYHEELRIIKEKSPESITTLHTEPHTFLPDEIIRNPNLDFYLYQSCHMIEDQANSYKFAQGLYHAEVKRPNGEPCYEGMGWFKKYGRFTAFDVRKAMWQSILSGAKAGFTYGAHGVWNWQRNSDEFFGEGNWMVSMEGNAAVKLPGAWDVGYGKQLFEKYDMFDLEPSEKILNKTPEIRMSVSRDEKKIVIYVPYNTNVEVDMDLTGYEFELIKMAEREVVKPKVEISNGRSIIGMIDYYGDVLIIGRR